MVSKRELESKLRLEKRSTEALTADSREAHKKRERAELALKRVAYHFGFYDAYRTEKTFSVPSQFDGQPAYSSYRVFDPEKLIADLDTIDTARAADEARARLGIGGQGD